MAFQAARFLRQATAPVLAQYAKGRISDWPEHFDWEVDQRSLLRSFEETITSLQPNHVTSVWRELAQIDSLADDVGQNVIFGMAASRADLCACLHVAVNQYARALELLLFDKCLFERALDHAAIGRDRYGRSWSAFNLGSLARAMDDETLKQELSLLLPAIFAPAPGKEPAVIVEIDRTSEQDEEGKTVEVLNIVVYVEGPMQSHLVIRDGGLVTDHLRPALRSGIVYDPRQGALDVIAKGGKPVRERIALAFARACTGSDAIDPVPLREFDLTPLKRGIFFPVDAADPIESVWLEEIELHGVVDGQPRIVLKRPPRRKELADDWTRRRSWLGVPADLIKLPLTKIHRAVIAVRFHPAFGERQAKTLQVIITCPNGCNLREHTERERLILQKYLPRWELVSEIGKRPGRAA